MNRVKLSTLPLAVASALRKAGAINRQSTTVLVTLQGLTRRVPVRHRDFPKGGSWSFLVCKCGRSCQKLRLYREEFLCRWCINPESTGKERSDDPEAYYGALKERLKAPRVANRQAIEHTVRKHELRKRRDALLSK